MFRKQVYNSLRHQGVNTPWAGMTCKINRLDTEVNEIATGAEELNISVKVGILSTRKSFTSALFFRPCLYGLGYPRQPSPSRQLYGAFIWSLRVVTAVPSSTLVSRETARQVTYSTKWRASETI